MRSSLLVFLLLFRRVVSRINNGSTLFHAKVIKDQILIIPFDRRIQLCTICHASVFIISNTSGHEQISFIKQSRRSIDRSKEILSIPLITYWAYSVFQFLETFARQNYNIYIFSSNFSSFFIFLSRLFPSSFSNFRKNTYCKKYVPNTFDNNLLADKRQVGIC